MPGEALTLQPMFSPVPAADGREGIGQVEVTNLGRELQRLAACRLPLVALEVTVPPGQGAASLPLLAELGLVAECAPDRFLMLCLGPAAARPGAERRLAGRVEALAPMTGPLGVTALQLCSSSINGLEDLQALLALERPVARPQRTARSAASFALA